MSQAFPPSPKVGQVCKRNGHTFSWNGVSWAPSSHSKCGAPAPVFISVAPPPNPVQGSLWYDANCNVLRIFYRDPCGCGSSWVDVFPCSDGKINEQGGIFEGAVYLNYEIPNNPLAAITVGYFESKIKEYLAENSYIKAGNGVVADSEGNIVSIDGLLY